jgi:hypothetical protein
MTTTTNAIVIDAPTDRVGARSRVELRETPEQGPIRALPRALVGPRLWVRNRVSVQRLRHEVERGGARAADVPS